MTGPAHRPMLFYDGVCNLCSGFVQFVLRRNGAGHITVAPLQSSAAQEFLARYRIDSRQLDTMVCVVDGRAYTRSTAVIRVLQGLPGGWTAIRALLVIPAVVRDWAYDVVGRNRYRWFGRRSACFLPPAGTAARMEGAAENATRPAERSASPLRPDRTP